MPRILSIDWDYLIDTSIEDASVYFPTPIQSKINRRWLRKYRNPEYKDDLLQTGVNPLLFEGLLNLEVTVGTTLMIAKEHHEILPLIMDASTKTDIYNLDFHHDCWETNKGIDCGNWLRHAIEEKKVASATWLTTDEVADDLLYDLKTSEMLANLGIVTSSNIDTIRGMDFDAIFLCKSEPWSPPHLDHYFLQLANSLITKANLPMYGDKSVLVDRWVKLQTKI